MKLAPRSLWHVLLGSLALGSVFAACASGSQVEDPPVGSGGAAGVGGFGGAAAGGAGQGGGTGIPPGQIGGACKETADCVTGNCTDVGTLKVCTQVCPPACPDGTYCALVEGDPLCVPDMKQECASCAVAADCKLASDQCLRAPQGDLFCARDCTTLGDCAPGFTCVEASQYGQSGSPPDGGAGGAAAGGAGQGGALHPSGQPFKFCVPEAGASCGCGPDRDKVERSCEVKSQAGVCTGSQACDGASGQWSACDAPPPAPETCNGKDDDCNGAIDDGDPNAMCGDGGAPPPNTTGWGCNAGKCGPGPCAAGWSAYPPGAAKDGCTCQMELGEPNDTCATATPVAGVTDEVGSTVQINGTLSSETDVDVWTFDSADKAEAATNSYHLSIAFTPPAPNEEFVFDVVRGDKCEDAPVGPATAVTSYDWCVDGTDGDKQGEKACGPTAAVHCGDHSSKYFVRVHRKPGAKGTCSVYQLTVTGAGGAACDFTQKCPPI